MSKTQHDFNVTIENYTKAIWNLSHSHTSVRNVDLSKHLGITRASVSGMLHKLEKLKYIQKRQLGAQICLTKKGEQIALATIRKHRLIEMFLSRTLKLSGLELHEEAEILEHAISPQLLERIDEYLQRPERDDSGMIIPRQGPFLHSEFDSNCLSLMDAKIGSHTIIVSIADYNSEILKELGAKGLDVGQKLSVQAKKPQSYIHLILANKKQIVLSHEEALLIRVSPH
jgi:DtxR family transcriptional regulator, Mn-dependent transcriptional regulator